MMKLLVISNPVSVEREAILINALFQSGLEVLHLRKPGISSLALAALLEEIDPLFHNRIALHQCYELAETYGITRLHFAEAARKLADYGAGRHYWQTIREQGFIMSTSIHELHTFPGQSFFDYVFYGPVFNSLSKPGYLSALPPGFRLTPIAGAPEIIAVGGIEAFPVAGAPEIIAVGGIEASNFSQLEEMGFAGGALLGALWLDPDKAVEVFNELLELSL